MAPLPPTGLIRIDDRRALNLRLQLIVQGLQPLAHAKQRAAQRRTRHRQPRQLLEQRGDLAVAQAGDLVEPSRQCQHTRTELNVADAEGLRALARVTTYDLATALRTLPMVEDEFRRPRTNFRQIDLVLMGFAL